MIEAFDLSGRTALITGAGSETGIGIATARLLAQMGAEVILTSTTDRINDRAAGLRAEGLSARGVVADLTDEQQVARLPEHVDVLVNNAGMTRGGPLETYPMDLARECFETNVFGHDQHRHGLRGRAPHRNDPGHVARWHPAQP